MLMGTRFLFWYNQTVKKLDYSDHTTLQINLKIT